VQESYRPRYFPVALDIRGQRCVVVGGGEIATHKARGLLEHGARVTIISPDLSPELEALAGEGRVEVVRRTYRPGDLAGAFLVVSATDDRSVNEIVAEEAFSAGTLVNCVDDPPRCNFIYMSMVRRGPLCISITTDGLSPAMAKHLRRQLSSSFGPEHGLLVQVLGELRREIMERHPDLSLEERARIFEVLLGSDPLGDLARGDVGAVRRRAWALVEEAVDRQAAGKTARSKGE